ncbi:hypothetical protein [Aureispira sp. CCB-E]|uniref:hypothetical protein n=1 Tax=Aureispira sp. CCB-E TaxID=3051121 RepID=UPI0028684303|nr:hypothetical protein [Aureispira sp. CCB-E]WMX13773.1 hypothetical protein QP953_23260 [Aureispira sp. CCB-E]
MKIELAHDFIAKKIYEEASIEDKARARATKMVHERYQHYLSSKNFLLTERELVYINPFIERMDLIEEEQYYIRKSKKAIKKEKLMRRIKDIALVALLSGIVFSSWGYWERQRFFHASKHLASAQDSINVLLRNQKGARSDIPITSSDKNKTHQGGDPLSPLVFFSTIKLEGKVTNEQNEPINEALVQIMGAQVLTKEDGTYEFYLVLPPQNIGKNISLHISKTNYLPTSTPIDTDNPSVQSAFTLVRE